MLSKDVFQNKEIKNIFKKYLNSKSNSESFEFLEQLEVLKSKRLVKDKILVINLIILQFIKDGSPSELNLDSNIKNNFFKNFQDQKFENEIWFLDIKPNDIFNEIESEVKKQLMCEYYHDFIKEHKKEITKLNKI